MEVDCRDITIMKNQTEWGHDDLGRRYCTSCSNAGNQFVKLSIKA